MSTAEKIDTEDNKSNADDLERKVGGAEIQPTAEQALPPPPPTPKPCPAIERATSSLDTRLNPNAPVFVPQFKAELLAAKLYDRLGPYTRWSTASSEDISYGPRLDSIWREFSVEQVRPISPHVEVEPYQVDLELDEVQAMNVGAESYDPKLSKSESNPIAQSEVKVIDIVGDVQPEVQPEVQQSQDQTPAEEKNDSGKGFQPRYPRAGRRCCVLM
ncbi:hypothetical protein KR038_000747 [Drosophila bunnanda]|nr:hypothetical protein KR038_000747 [Drosophila bunnanda]